MAVDPIKFAALESAFDAVNAPDTSALTDAVDFLDAYADIGVWDAGTGEFTFVDVGRARILAKTLSQKPEKRRRSKETLE